MIEKKPNKRPTPEQLLDWHRKFEAQKQHAKDTGDVDTLAFLEKLERIANDPSQQPPSVVEQIRSHLERLGSIGARERALSDPEFMAFLRKRVEELDNQ